jgi:hypothetical protein
MIPTAVGSLRRPGRDERCIARSGNPNISQEALHIGLQRLRLPGQFGRSAENLTGRRSGLAGSLCDLNDAGGG